MVKRCLLYWLLKQKNTGFGSRQTWLHHWLAVKPGAVAHLLMHHFHHPLATQGSPWSESCLPFQVPSHYSKPHATYKNEPITNPQSGHCFISRALLFISFTLNILPHPSIPPLNFSLSTWLISTYPTELGADTFQTYSISFHSIP